MPKCKRSAYPLHLNEESRGKPFETPATDLSVPNKFADGEGSTRGIADALEKHAVSDLKQFLT